jgi:adenylate cyclase class IV
MGSLSLEIKARCSDPARIRKILLARGASFKGLDRQIDTYFRVPSGRSQYQSIEAELRLGPSKLPLSKRKTKFGRLKLREGNIENALIYYKRTDQKNSKKCDSLLWRPCEHKGQAFGDGLSPMRSLKQILKVACGVLAVVDKKREIYFIKNVKFHIDRVKKLGNFMEIEVFGPARAAAKLKKQCGFFQKLLGIRAKDLVADSYSDQILKARKRSTGNGQR